MRTHLPRMTSDKSAKAAMCSQTCKTKVWNIAPQRSLTVMSDRSTKTNHTTCISTVWPGTNTERSRYCLQTVYMATIQLRFLQYASQYKHTLAEYHTKVTSGYHMWQIFTRCTYPHTHNLFQVRKLDQLLWARVWHSHTHCRKLIHIKSYQWHSTCLPLGTLIIQLYKQTCQLSWTCARTITQMSASSETQPGCLHSMFLSLLSHTQLHLIL